MVAPRGLAVGLRRRPRSLSSVWPALPGPPYLYEGFLVGQHNGRWGTPRNTPMISSVSCPSAGSCGADGLLGWDGGGYPEGAFVISQHNGRWGKVQHLAGAAARGGISSLSCASAGNCGAGGFYFSGDDENGDHLYGALVVGERNGRWATPEGLDHRSLEPTNFMLLGSTDASICTALSSTQTPSARSLVIA
jgi:hypothetical protein